MKNIITKKTFKNKVLLVFFTFITLFSFFNIAAAQRLNNPINSTDLTTLIVRVMRVIVTVGSIIVVLAVIYAGFLFVSARGNSEEIKKAKLVFFWVLVGAIILLGAEILSQIIMNTARELGVNIP